MRRIARARAMPRLLQAAFALAFVVLSALQPSLFSSANATSMSPASAVAQSGADQAHRSEAAGHHDGDVSIASDDGTLDHHGLQKAADDKSCEVHCAPAQAMPVDCPPLPQPSGGRIGLASEAALFHGMNHEFIKPPRP